MEYEKRALLMLGGGPGATASNIVLLFNMFKWHSGFSARTCKAVQRARKDLLLCVSCDHIDG
jgi:hypothetical protein